MMKSHKTQSLGRRLRFQLEAWLFAMALRLIPALSRATIMRLARMGGRLAWTFARRDRRIAMANLDLAFGETKTVSEKHLIVRQAFQTFAQTGLDYFWFSRDRTQRMRDWVVVDEAARVWMQPGKRLVGVTAHFGNWEMLGWLFVFHGAAIASVAKPVKNYLIDAEINRIRTLSGQQIVPREGALRALVRALKSDGAIALLLDQDTLPAEGGVFVPFFGIPVPISTAGAGLALKLKAPILMAFCVCNPDGRYHGYASKLFLPEEIEGMNTDELTAKITTALEEELRRNPEYWLWSYKRWKRRLPGVDPARYPYYADC
ncbi:MAG: lysophospholipid acyltransferase family protein [bacterium]